MNSLLATAMKKCIYDYLNFKLTPNSGLTCFLNSGDLGINCTLPAPGIIVSTTGVPKRW